MAAEKAKQRAKIEATIARRPVIEQFVANVLSDYRSGKFDNQLQTTDSGLKYLIHEEGAGSQIKAGDRATVQYYGSLMNGNRFDGSFSRGEGFPLTVGVGQVIPGWDEGLALLKRGSKASFFIPANLGYGRRGSPPNIPPNTDLYFYVEPE